MSQVPTKIVLKSTTKMSLNDRFTHIQKTRPQPTVQNIRGNMMQQQQQSVRNQRQTQQNINRPGLQQQPKQLKQNKSLKQRLGASNVKARLNFNAVRGRGGVQRGNFQNQGGFRGQNRGNRFVGRGQQRGGGRGRGRGGAGFNRQQSMGSADSSFEISGGNRGGFNPRFNNQRGGRGNRGRGRGGAMRGRGGNNPNNRGPSMSDRARGYFRGRGRGRGRPFNNKPNFDNQSRGGGGRGARRGGRGMRGAGRGQRGGRGRGGQNSNPTAEELDLQLDVYMSKTKSYLDTELDQYMADANP